VQNDGRIIDVRYPLNWRSPLTRGLIAWWKILPGASGGTTLRDIAGGHHGTLSSMDPATDWVDGVKGQHLTFDGTDDYVEITTGESDFDLDYTDPWSIVAVVKSPDVAAWRSVFGKGQTAADDYRGYAVQFRNDGTLTASLIYDYSTANRAENWTSAAYDDDQWHHVVITYNGGGAATDFKFFVDGVTVAANDAEVNTVTTSLNTNHNPRIGTSADDANPFNGEIAEVALYGRVLLADEVYALYDEEQRGYPTMLRRLPRRTSFVPTAPAARRVFIIS